MFASYASGGQVMLRYMKAFLTLDRERSTFRSLSLNLVMICFIVPFVVETGRELTEIKDPQLEIFEESASDRGRQAFISMVSSCQMDQSHSEAQSLPTTLAVASSGVPSGLGEKSQSDFVLLDLRTRSCSRTLDRARAYA